jgi:predicted acetyltransferase
MHQLAPRITVASIKQQPVRKRILEDHDLQVVTDLVCAGLRQGLYTDIFHGRTRADVHCFLRRLVTRCEFRAFDTVRKRFRVRAAALWIYVVNNVVVGFCVLAEAVSESTKRGIELLMFGVAMTQRGMGYGSAILDGLIRTVGHLYFNLVVRCPGENQILAAMLLSRGFDAMERYDRGRVFHFLPRLFESYWARQVTSSLRVE